jgi:hypothetical protein
MRKAVQDLSATSKRAKKDLDSCVAAAAEATHAFQRAQYNTSLKEKDILKVFRRLT